MPDAVLLAPLVLSVVLAVAGAAKLRDPAGTAAALTDLEVPRVLHRRTTVAALPWVELVLALGLVLLPAPWVLLAAVAATLLMAAYVGLVVRVLREGTDVSCRCFGAADDGTVDRRTLLRNVLLLAAGVLTVLDGVLGGSFVGRLATLSAGSWAWLVGVALVAVLVAVVVRPSQGSSAEDDQRAGIPFLEVRTADGGQTSLPELASLRPVLLVRLSSTCTSCARISEVVGEWPALLPEVDVRVVSGRPLGEPVPPSWPGVLHDPDDRVATVLGMARPSAVLLGADALVAGGPVNGAGAVERLVAEVREQLDEAARASSAAR